ncbi:MULTISPECIES: DUF5000 domain-containing lipoprotein [unclassified Pedobacter]|uniref:DUF5000 domain-containing lipoprotein n=1 Tax=unclassified Pedobacter TaxID=2628915 RepID=UPI0014200767|nr:MULTISPECIES: DUF4959 domain-containing protein [unclassified Pedobacter]NII85211.1 hypothetical protein [Pedobacter sp. SG908]NMN39875.1 hypothetical protein [Pedobacter sp. SG918]
MKKINKLFFWVLSMMIVSFIGCKQEALIPFEKNETPPGQVSNILVENGPANAKISYTLPTDKDLLYVKAVYKLANGTQAEVKASYYSSSLLVEGFGDTNEHEVMIYAVNRSEVASAPKIVKIKPLENPIRGVFRNLKVIPDFAGINFTSSNPAKADLSIEVMIMKNGKYESLGKNIYTSAADINQSIRGLDTLSSKFAITIRDRWLNYSDTLYTTLKPLYETALSKSLYKALKLPTDAVQTYTSTALENMWDNNFIDWPRCSLTDVTQITPQWVTFDIGKPAVLSRIVVWNYPEYLNAGRMYYYGGNLKDFEIWASDNPPADGSFNNWVMIGSYKSTKPSGSAYGVQTSEDYAFANAGISYTFGAVGKKFRYLRIKSNKNWQGTTFQSISEIQCYGDPR